MKYLTLVECMEDFLNKAATRTRGGLVVVYDVVLLPVNLLVLLVVRGPGCRSRLLDFKGAPIEGALPIPILENFNSMDFHPLDMIFVGWQRFSSCYVVISWLEKPGNNNMR